MSIKFEADWTKEKTDLQSTISLLQVELNQLLDIKQVTEGASSVVSEDDEADLLWKLD